MSISLKVIGITKDKQFLLLAIVFAFLVLNATAHGKEIPFDFNHCWSLKFTGEIVKADELSINNFELLGIVTSNTDDKMFDNISSHCINFLVRTGNGIDLPGYCKYMAPDESYYVSQASCDSSGCSWKIIYGTGTFKGASGGASSFSTYTQAQPISAGTSQGCSRHVGTITLPDTQ